MLLKKPRIASLSEVRITRNGETEDIEYFDGESLTVNLGRAHQPVLSTDREHHQ